MSDGHRKMRKTQMERREAVLESAAQLFAEKGFRDSGVAAIAEHAGVHVAQIYRDFSRKEGLIESLAQNCLDAIFADMDEALRGTDLRTGIRRWLNLAIKTAQEVGPSQLIGEVLAEATRNPSVARIIFRKREEACRRLYAMLDGRVGASISSLDLEMVAEFLLTLNISFYTCRGINSDDDAEALVSLAEAALMAVMFPPSAPPPGPPHSSVA